MLSVEDCVESSASFIAGTDASFCSVMQSWRGTLRNRARRQTAAVWANVCAGQHGLIGRNGQAISLDPATSVSVTGYTGTVAEWLTFAGSELARLNHANEKNRSVRESYRALIRTAWNINHGVGIGTTCLSGLPQASATTGSGSQGRDSDALLASGVEPEPLSTEIMDDLDGPLTLGQFQPNPFVNSTRLAYAISATTNQDVTIGVYDISGRLVKELVRGNMAPGQYEVRWDGSQTDGTPARSGLYFVLGRIGGLQAQTRVTFVH